MNIRDRILLWIFAPMLTAVALILAPEVFGLAAEATVAREEVSDEVDVLVA